MKKRSLFMVIVLLMMGVNMKAGNLASATTSEKTLQVASSEGVRSSSKYVEKVPQIILSVPVNISIPAGINVSYFSILEGARNGNAYSKTTTTGKMKLECKLHAGNQTFSQTVDLHDGNYRTLVKFTDIPVNDLIKVKTYDCSVYIGLEDGAYVTVGSIKEKSSLLVSAEKDSFIMGEIE